MTQCIFVLDGDLLDHKSKSIVCFSPLLFFLSRVTTQIFPEFSADVCSNVFLRCCWTFNTSLGCCDNTQGVFTASILTLTPANQWRSHDACLVLHTLWLVEQQSGSQSLAAAVREWSAWHSGSVRVGGVRALAKWSSWKQGGRPQNHPKGELMLQVKGYGEPQWQNEGTDWSGGVVLQGPLNSPNSFAAFISHY